MLLLPKSFIETYLNDLEDEDKLEIMEIIFNWYFGIETTNFNSKVVKILFNNLLPVIDNHKTNYLNGSDGGAPVGNQNAKKQPKTTPLVLENNHQTTSLVLENKPKEKEKEKENNTSIKEVLLNNEEQLGDGKPETLEGVSVSKGLESLEKIFPLNKRDVGIDEINLWNSFTQNQKANVIKSASLYVRKELQNENGKYMKKLSKWMVQQNDKGIQDELLPKKKPDSKQTFKYTDGIIYGILQEKLGSTKGIDYIYHILNTSGLTKEELTNTVKELNKEELLELAKN